MEELELGLRGPATLNALNSHSYQTFLLKSLSPQGTQRGTEDTIKSAW